MKTEKRESSEQAGDKETAGKELEPMEARGELCGNSNEHTSESPSRLKIDIFSEEEEQEVGPFRPVDPHVFVKASRKYLAQNPPEASHLADLAAGLDTVQLRACNVPNR